MNKKFILQFLAFITFGLIIPVVYLLVRFQAFTTKTTISIWGLIAFIFLFASFVLLIKCYLEGMKTKYSLFKKILLGFIKVIVPLITFLGVIIWIRLKGVELISSMDKMIEFLLVLLGCWIITIVVNPLPKWMFDNNIEGYTEIADKVFKKGGNE